MIWQLVRRDFEARFVGSLAGWLWTLIHPLVQLAIWVFVFQVCLKVPRPADATHSYAVWLFCGFLPWMVFADTLQRSANCLVENANLITKTVFPSEILPVTLFLSSLVSHALTLLLAIVAVLWTEGTIHPQILALPLFTLIAGLFGIGLAWIAASLQVYLRDTAQVVMVFVAAFFWANPIFLDVSNYPQWARPLLTWNPLAVSVRAYRGVLLHGRLPAWQETGIALLVAAAFFAVGGLFFRRLKRGFADVL